MSDDAFSYDGKNLDGLIKALKDALPRARVGILGDKTIRREKSLSTTNAGIGAIHEFGGGGQPIRSFLRVPIAEHLQSRMDESGAFDKDALALVIKEQSVVPWVKKVATIAVGIVADAFDTGGFGKWPAWKTPGYKNNTGQILKNTQQLSESITSEVK